MARTRSFSLLFVILLGALVAPAIAFPQEYTVEPAFGVAGFAAQDIVPITFWDLTLREMAIVLALAISPLLLAPVEIVFAAKVLSLLGFRRIARGNVLAHSIRNAIYGSIQKRPGISPGELAAETGISRGALAYHLALLRALGKIVLVKDHGAVCCFENSGTFNRCEQLMLTCLRSDTGRKILRALARSPGLSRAELGQILCVSGPTVTWHMKRLASDGAVSISRQGKFCRYVISDEMTAFLKRAGSTGEGYEILSTGENGMIPRAAWAQPAES